MLKTGLKARGQKFTQSFLLRFCVKTYLNKKANAFILCLSMVSSTRVKESLSNVQWGLVLVFRREASPLQNYTKINFLVFLVANLICQSEKFRRSALDKLRFPPNSRLRTNS